MRGASRKPKDGMKLPDPKLKAPTKKKPKKEHTGKEKK